MAPGLFFPSENKVLNESNSFKNRVDSSDSTNSFDFVNIKRNSVIIMKNSVLRMARSESSAGSQEFQKNSQENQSTVRRGRPKASSIPLLQALAAESNNPLNCPYCKRDFKRKKALNTHVRTHTREKPYVCTYPHCNHKFTQSSHLDAHIRIHTKEKPFYCPEEGCSTDFTHQSRVCKMHPVPVKRKEKKYTIKDIEDFSIRPIDEQEWLIQYFQNKENKATVTRKRKDTNETDSVPPSDEGLVSSGRGNEQSEGDEHVFQEAQRLKRKRNEIKENVDNKIQQVENFMEVSNTVLDTKNSPDVSDDSNNSLCDSDPISSSPKEEEDAAWILLYMSKGPRVFSQSIENVLS